MVKKTVKQKWQPLPDNANTMQSMVVPEVDDRTVHFEEITVDDLKNLSKFIDQSNKTIELENSIFERYLTRMDPTSLAKMDEILEATANALQKAEKTALLGSVPSNEPLNRMTEESSMSSEVDTISARSRKSKILSETTEKERRVQPAHKIEMVNREIDELRNILEGHRKKARDFNYVLRCQSEELSGRLQEITEARNFFEQKLLTESVDPLSGKLPGEKFLRFFETRLKQEEIEIDRMRIKTGSLKNQLKKVQLHLAQKEEMGEVLHAVDFEQLQIENNECQKRLEEKIANVIEIKKINGRYGNLLNVHKKKLNQLMHKLAELKENKSVKEKMIKELAVDEEKINSEVDAAVRSVEKITHLMESYTVPELMEYILKKAELNDLKKELKIKERQMKLKDLALASQVHRIKNITHSLSKTQFSR